MASPREIPFIQGVDDVDCVLACLAMVLAYFGKTVRREEIRELLGSSRDGVTAKDLLSAAAHFGLRGRGVRIELDALTLLDPGAILHWRFAHFVVFERLQGAFVHIVDPAQGRRRVPMDEFSRSFTGVALLLEPSERFLPSAAPASGERGYFARLLRGSGDWGRILTTSVFLQVLALALPLVTGAIVDRVVPRGDRHLLFVLGVALVLIVGFHLLTTLIRGHLLLHLRTLLDLRMTLGCLDHLISLPYAFFQKRSAGDLILRLNSNTIIREILTSSALSAVLDGALMLIYLALLFFVSASIGALVLVLGALQVSVFLFTRRRQREISDALVSTQALSHGYQVEMLTGMETLKAMGCEQRAEEHWQNLFVDVLNASLAAGRLGAAFDAVSSTLRMGAPLLILGVGTLKVLDGTLTLGTMLALNAFAVGVFAPLSSLVATAAELQRLGSYVDRIADIQNTPPEQDLEKVRPAGPLRGRIKLDGVSFRYGPLNPLVLKDISIAIDPGQFVAIVGRSGSGKSTLASLLFGLQIPTSGRVLYDGVNLTDLDLRSVRQKLGIVTQETRLFSATIRDNIALSDPELPLSEIIEAARLAQIHDEIEEMPLRYETRLGEAGGLVSGGQRQRIALARALVRRPAVLLLDEATSDLDAATERRVQDALASLKCTRILIAHRLSTIIDADAILVMDNGELVERGTHDELLARVGVYAALVGGQMPGEQRSA